MPARAAVFLPLRIAQWPDPPFALDIAGWPPATCPASTSRCTSSVVCCPRGAGPDGGAPSRTLGEPMGTPRSRSIRAADRIVAMHPEPALVQEWGVEDHFDRIDPGEGPPGPLGGGRGHGPGVGEQPRIQRGVEEMLRLAPFERVRSGERLLEGIVAEHLEHLIELLRGGHHGHVPVGAGEDAGRDEGFAARRQSQGGRLTASILVCQQGPLSGGQRVQCLHGRTAVGDVSPHPACGSQDEGRPVLPTAMLPTKQRASMPGASAAGPGPCDPCSSSVPATACTTMSSHS